jgi:hypothetical protein
MSYYSFPDLNEEDSAKPVTRLGDPNPPAKKGRQMPSVQAANPPASPAPASEKTDA